MLRIKVRVGFVQERNEDDGVSRTNSKMTKRKQVMVGMTTKIAEESMFTQAGEDGQWGGRGSSVPTMMDPSKYSVRENVMFPGSKILDVLPYMNFNRIIEQCTENFKDTMSYVEELNRRARKKFWALRVKLLRFLSNWFQTGSTIEEIESYFI